MESLNQIHALRIMSDISSTFDAIAKEMEDTKDMYLNGKMTACAARKIGLNNIYRFMFYNNIAAKIAKKYDIEAVNFYDKYTDIYMFFAL